MIQWFVIISDQCKKLLGLKHSVRAIQVMPLRQQKSLLCALTKRAVVVNICYGKFIEYRKNSNIIRTIFTKNRGMVAGVRIIHEN